MASLQARSGIGGEISFLPLHRLLVRCWKVFRGFSQVKLGSAKIRAQGNESGNDCLSTSWAKITLFRRREDFVSKNKATGSDIKAIGRRIRQVRGFDLTQEAFAEQLVSSQNMKGD